MNATQKQIAKELGVSVSTVSRALSDSYEISEELKKKINDYAEKIKYQPNPHARSLRSSTTKNIAVLVPDISNYFFSLSLKGIESVVHEKGYNLMIYQTNDNLAIEEQIFRYLENGLVAGVLSAVASNKKGYVEHVTRLNNLIPIIFFDRSIKEMSIPHVTCNDYESGFTATVHLIEKGCKNILFIGIDESVSVTSDRLKGYMNALKAKGIEVIESNILLSESVDDMGLKIKKRFAEINKADGVFSSVERYTMQLYKVCNELNITIPGQLKIISFSNNPFVTLMNPPLSVVIPPAYEMGKEAANLLFQLLQKKKELTCENKIMQCTLSYSRSSVL
jgi:LacI family transcriptional regulator